MFLFLKLPILERLKYVVQRWWWWVWTAIIQNDRPTHNINLKFRPHSSISPRRYILKQYLFIIVNHHHHANINGPALYFCLVYANFYVYQSSHAMKATHLVALMCCAACDPSAVALLIFCYINRRSFWFDWMRTWMIILNSIIVCVYCVVLCGR